MRHRVILGLSVLLVTLGSAALALGRRHPPGHRTYHRHSLLAVPHRPRALLARKGTRAADLAVSAVLLKAPGAAPGRAFPVLVKARRVGRQPHVKLRGILSAYLSAGRRLPRRLPPVAASAGVIVKPRGNSSPTRLNVVVPLGTRPGHYTVFVCIAVLGRYRDTHRANNCHAAGKKATVVAVPAAPPATTTTKTTTSTSTTTTTTSSPPPSSGGSPPPDTPVPVNAPAPAPGPADAAAPSAASLAPTLSSGEATSFRSSIAFLFTGSNPIQPGVSDPSVITDAGAALLHGMVTDTAGHPLGGVRISVLGAPQYGHTDTASDGTFAMAVNGGAQLALNVARAGYIPLQTNVTPPVNQSTAVPAVALTAYQGQADDINLASSAPIQVAQGDVESDTSGTRRATLLFSAGTHATMHMPDGSTQPLTDMHVRATEFTVGAYGQAAMPGQLPPTSAYTYADEFSADEAVAAGATSVTFDKPAIAYVDNFLGFPTGAAVPSGAYDGSQDAWKPAPNGVVVKVLSTAGGTAQLSVDSSGQPATSAELSALGITAAELQAVAVNYVAGDSLWRVPLTHFSSWDFNFLPQHHQPDPPSPPQPDQPPQDNSCHAPGGSTIMCDSQAVGEDVPVAGTPFSLHYQSDRVPGYRASDAIDIPVTSTGGSLDQVDHIDVDVDILGHTYHHEFCLPGAQGCAPGAQQVTASQEAGLTDQVVWDGTDGFGRAVTGGAIADVTVTYAVFQSYSYSYASTSGGGGGGTGGEFGETYPGQGTVPARTLDYVSDTEQVPVGAATNVSGVGLGDWSLSALDSFDPATGVLHRGDGSDQNTQALAPTLAVFAGSLSGGSGTGDGGPATQATLSDPTGLLGLPDGSVLIADCGDNRVRKVAPDGTISTIAGTGTAGESGDGGPATAAELSCPTSLARAADGTLYVGDAAGYSGGSPTVRRIAPDGTITTIAGGGQARPADSIGNPATTAQLSSVSQIAVGPDGAVYIADTGNGVIERVDASDTLSIIDYDSTTDTTLGIRSPQGVAVDSAGDIFVSDAGSEQIMRINGTTVTPIAGTNGTAGDTGDGGPATSAQLNGPGPLSLTTDGSLYVAEQYSGEVRVIGTDGKIRRVAGGGSDDPTQGSVPAPAADLGVANGVYASADGTVLISNYDEVFKTKAALSGVGSSATLVPTSDGTQVDAFDAGGREQALYDAVSGVKLLSFEYDPAGRLSDVVDAYGRKTTIERDAAGNPTEIVAPGGQITMLSLGAGGRLASISDPDGNTTQLAYDGNGQLSSFTDPLGKSSSIVYDSLGRVTSDTDTAGATTTLEHALSGDGVSTTTVHLPGGRTQVYKDYVDGYGDETRTSVDPSGGVTTMQSSGDGKLILTLPDGTTETSTSTGDPRFGMAAPIVSSLDYTTPNHAGDQTEQSTRTVTLSNPDDPLSVQSITDTYTVGSNSPTTITYDASSRTLTETSPEGRVSSQTYDTHDGEISETSPISGDPLTITRNSSGEPIKYAQGNLSETLTYDSAGDPISATDALGETYRYGWDAASQMISLTRPDGGLYQLGRDADGRLSSLTTPSGAVHKFAYSPVGLLSSYLPPGATAGTSYAYNTSRSATGLTLADGRSLSDTYDAGGRLTAVTASTNDGNVQASYDGSTQDVSSLTRTFATGTAQALTLSHDGEVMTGQAFSGPATGAYTYKYADGLLTDLSLSAGGQTADTPKAYDQDGLLTGAGPFTFTLDSGTGLPSGISDQTRAEKLTYDALGRETGRDISVGATALFSEALTRDAVGHIASRQQTIAGTSHTLTYAYDSDGRLTSVQTDGSASEAYAYTSDGDLASRQSGGSAAQALTYDSHGQLTGVGSTAYTFNAAGQLTGRGSDSFSYGVRTGELEQATVGGSTVSYRYDALGRRVARTVSGATEQYLYGDPDYPYRLTASIASDGTLTTYNYDHLGRLIGFKRGSATYYVATDQLGSPVVVSDASGTVVKQISRDAYGEVLSDSAPSFDLPIGYAGGLYDPLTGLVLMGTRDYDPQSGRFTERDPALLGGGLNFYAYAGGDPVNYSDPTGLYNAMEDQANQQYIQNFFAPEHDPNLDPYVPPPTPLQKLGNYIKNQWDKQLNKHIFDPLLRAQQVCEDLFHGKGPESAVSAVHELIDWATGKQVLPVTPGNMANQMLDKGVQQSEQANQTQSMGPHEYSQYQYLEQPGQGF